MEFQVQPPSHFQSLLKIVEDKIIQPSAIEIHNIYPNPTNTSFTISFTISTKKINNPISISIKNILGKEIFTTSIEGNNDRYRWTWNGLDKNGISAPTGTYFISVFNNDQAETRKITILK